MWWYCIRDGNVAALLKLTPCCCCPGSSPGIRDGNVAALLKLSLRPMKRQEVLLCIRDGNVAALLKPRPRLRDCGGARGGIRDGNVAALLKQDALHRDRFAAYLHPRRKRRGPIEALNLAFLH